MNTKVEDVSGRKAGTAWPSDGMLAAASILSAKSERIAQFDEAEWASVRGAAIRRAAMLGAALRAKSRE